MSKKELTEQQKLFLEVLFSEECRGNLKLAHMKAGYSDNTSVYQTLNGLREEILEKAKETLVANSAQAVYALLDVIKDGTGLGSTNKLKAVQDLLNRVGLSEKEKDNTLKVPDSGLVILPAKNLKVVLDDSEGNTPEE